MRPKAGDSRFMVVFEIPTFITTERISELLEQETQRRYGPPPAAPPGKHIRDFTLNTTCLDRGMIVEFVSEETGRRMCQEGTHVLRADSGAEMRLDVGLYVGKKCFCCAMKS